MSLKPLQAEQSEMIKRILQRKDIVLNGEINNQHILKDIVRGGYTYIYTNSKIAFSKQFKNSILEHTFFTDCLAILAIDEIYLVEE